MRHFNALVLDENVATVNTSTSPLYTSADLNQRLGQFDQLAIHYVGDNFGGTGANLNVAIEHSADGRNWIEKKSAGGSFEIVTTSFNTSNPTGAGFDVGSAPSLGLVRLKIWQSGTLAAFHLKLYVTARDQS